MSELSALKQAQYHLKELEKHIKDNKWYGHLYSHLAGRRRRTTETGRNLRRSKSQDSR